MTETYCIGLGKEIVLDVGTIANYPADVLVGYPELNSIEQIILQLFGQTVEEFEMDTEDVSLETIAEVRYFNYCCAIGSSIEHTVTSLLPEIDKIKATKPEDFLVDLSRLVDIESDDTPKRHYLFPIVLIYDSKEDGWLTNSYLVTQAVSMTLSMASKRRNSSIAFPPLNQGIYSVPLEDAIPAMVNEFVKHLLTTTSIQRISLVVKTDEEYCRIKPLLEQVIEKSCMYV
ncbi:MAG: hypothetical protein WC254_07665 [Candidatus Woesearchaeota archaeon]|jgi:hypothetical protein